MTKRYRRREFLKALGAIGGTAVAGMVASKLAEAYNIPSVEKIYSPDSPLYPADVIVFRDGEYAVAVDKKGYTIAKSTDHADVWNSVIESNRRIAVFGEFTFTKKVYKESLENVEIFGRAKITIIGDGYPAFHFVDPKRLEIRDIEIDGQGQTQSTSFNSGILIESIDRVVEDVKIIGCTIHDVVRAGIHLNIQLSRASTTGTYGFRRVVIKDNYIYDMVKGSSGTDGNGIWLGRGYMEGVRIRDNFIENMLSVGIGVGTNTAFGTYRDVVIDGNRIINSRYYGIDASGLESAVISKNYIRNDDSIITGNTYGIFIETANIKPSKRVKIVNNIVDGVGLYGIYVYSNNHDVEIVGNITRRIKNPSAAGARHIVATGERVVARNNRVYGDGDGDLVAGIQVGSYGEILDNLLYKVTGEAILLYEKDNVIVRGNHIINPSSNAIHLAGCTGVIVEGNYIEGVPANRYGIIEGNTANKASDYNIIKNNVLRNISGTPVSTVGSNTITADNVVI